MKALPVLQKKQHKMLVDILYRAKVCGNGYYKYKCSELITLGDVKAEEEFRREFDELLKLIIGENNV